jgi:hypothetical protein
MDEMGISFQIYKEKCELSQVFKNICLTSSFSPRMESYIWNLLGMKENRKKWIKHLFVSD